MSHDRSYRAGTVSILGRPRTRYECRLCRYDTATEEAIRLHVTRKHDVELDDEPDDDPDPDTDPAGDAGDNDPGDGAEED